MSKNKINQTTKPGNLVLINPGNYLTEFKKELDLPAFVSLSAPQPGLVIQDWEDSDTKLVLISEGGISTSIFANERSIKKL